MNNAAQHPSSNQAQRYHYPDFRKMISRFPITYSLIGITAIIFVAQWTSGYIQGLSLICGPFDVICQVGAKVNQAIAAGEIWRFVSPIFIHVNMWHVFVNMYSLHAVGPSVETFYGRERMLIIYVLSGITGVAFSLAFNPFNSVGASGAIFGIVGALAWFLFQHRDLFGSVAKDNLLQIVMVILLNLLLGMSTMIDNWGHIGGLFGGIFTGWIMGPHWEKIQTLELAKRLVDTRPWLKVRVKCLFAVLAVVIVCLAAIISPFSK